MNHLRPKAIPDDLFQVDESCWQENGVNGEKLQLLARASFLKNLQTCRLAIFDACFPQSTFFLKEPGYSNYELWCFYSNVADGIDRLIEFHTFSSSIIACNHFICSRTIIPLDDWKDAHHGPAYSVTTFGALCSCLLSGEAMQPELRYELLFFYTRNELEHLQPLSQSLATTAGHWSLLDMIVAGANVLPLRSVQRVDMDFYDADVFNIGKIHIFVEAASDNGEFYTAPGYEASIHDGDFAETFRRLQHTCIKVFCVGIRESPFLRYWRSQEAAAFTVVSIHFGTFADTDYDVLDSIVNYLRPRTTSEVDVEESSWQENGNSDVLKPLSRNSFLNNLQTCRLFVLERGFPPSSFILGEPGYSNYELLCANSNIADAIDGFIESFVRNGCTNEKLESVCIQWTDHVGQKSPVLKQLKKPTKVGMPPPKIDMTAWLTCYVHQVTQCEMNSFVNTKHWKQMDVYKWTIEYDDEGNGRITTDIFQCRVKDL